MDIEKSIVSQCVNAESLLVFYDGGVSPEMFADQLYGEVYAYALSYFATHGDMDTAPTVSIMEFKFGSFPQDGEPANPSFLVENLKALVAKRLLTKAIKDSSELVQIDPVQASISLQEEIGGIVSLTSDKKSRIIYGEDLQHQKIIEDGLVIDSHAIGVPYPFAELTAHTNGIRKGEITVLAAPPSFGKSWVCCDMAISAKESGCNTYFATLEMNVEVMTQRMGLIQANKLETKVPPKLFTNGYPRDEYIASMDEARQEIADMPGKLVVENPQNRTVKGIFANARQNNCDFVIIDQLQFISRARGASRTEQIEDIINDIKNEACAHPSGKKMAVLLISQLNREGVKDEQSGRTASMTNLAMSASLEQVADTVLVMGRSAEEEANNLMRLSIVKGRRFPCKGWYLTWMTDERALFCVSRINGQPHVLED